ncbi:DeoR/GlpR family DNA-binding transcription regulator [Virgisporangium ochraceum]|uniref:DeoR family transcriptional regulator n=1 Tax=Virgisporangium ochraceum TaxID=65505 RepID=A0A8J4A2Y0_9ACTN|nr:DeoR/GlpR family DNA-binding transcription regulator [Virgisporangium ochraceum]GIJ72395.1 DeoR family transcriptional regulator [Virgisporangium ochraceum]
MLIAERRRRLLEHVRDRGYVSFRELADALHISESTVRRDLRSMVSDGLLTATRGGVGPAWPAAAPPGGPTAVHDRAGAATDPRGDDGSDPQRAGREAIAAAAAALVAPGSAILLGPGRTTTALARNLAAISHLTVVTNSVTVTDALVPAPQIDVLLIGGALRRSIGAVVGPITEQALQGLRGAQVFLSGEGVTAERGLTTPNVFAAATDQAMMAAGSQVVVLADHTKLGRDTMCQTVPSDRMDILVTDERADGAVVRRLRAEGIDVRIA